MQLSAEETVFCIPANYTRLAAAAAGFKWKSVLIAFVYGCVSLCEPLVYVLCERAGGGEVLTHVHVYMSKRLLVFICMLTRSLCACVTLHLEQTFMSSHR